MLNKATVMHMSRLNDLITERLLGSSVEDSIDNVLQDICSRVSKALSDENTKYPFTVGDSFYYNTMIEYITNNTEDQSALQQRFDYVTFYFKNKIKNATNATLFGPPSSGPRSDLLCTIEVLMNDNKRIKVLMKNSENQNDQFRRCILIILDK